MNAITTSIVSHNQYDLLTAALADIARQAPELKIIVTHNVASAADRLTLDSSFVVQITNPAPKGFGANHNAAFKHCTTPFFCVANPDVRLTTDPFPSLLESMADPRVGLVAPMVMNLRGEYDGNARHFPTPLGLLNKLMRGDDARYKNFTDAPIQVDWAAGMFMLFRAEAFEAIGGFDEGFHLYYEDVDICTRLWNEGWKVLLHPGEQVVHAAQRTSHRNLRYMRWHLASMTRYFRKHAGRLPVTHPSA